MHSSSSVLPDPGAALELVWTPISRATDLPARLLLNSDGRLMEAVNLVQARFNNQELPEYRFQISAPLAEIQYQFVVQMKDGSTLSAIFTRLDGDPFHN